MNHAARTSRLGLAACRRLSGGAFTTIRFGSVASLALGLALVVAGCAPTTPAGHSPPVRSRPPSTNALLATPEKPAKPLGPTQPPVKPVTLATPPATNVVLPRYPLVIPVARTVGRVHLVNTQAQFVVVDFGFTPLPRPEQRLTVFRTNRAVGNVRMTGAPRGSLMTADIMLGEAQVGDEVHPE